MAKEVLKVLSQCGANYRVVGLWRYLPVSAHTEIELCGGEFPLLLWLRRKLNLWCDGAVGTVGWGCVMGGSEGPPLAHQCLKVGLEQPSEKGKPVKIIQYTKRIWFRSDNDCHKAPI